MYIGTNPETKLGPGWFRVGSTWSQLGLHQYLVLEVSSDIRIVVPDQDGVGRINTRCLLHLGSTMNQKLLVLTVSAVRFRWFCLMSVAVVVVSNALTAGSTTCASTCSVLVLPYRRRSQCA